MLLEDYLQLKDKPYELGVSIFCKLSNNIVLKTLFQNKENSHNKKRLLEELELIAASRNNKKTVTAQIEKNVIQVAPPSQPKPSHQKFTNFKENVPDVLKPFHELANASYKERALLHNKLCESATHELEKFDRKRNYESERKAIQDKMLSLITINKSCWDTIFYYNENGKLPPVEDEFDIRNKTIRELVNAEKVIPSYITKLKQRLAKTSYESDKYAAITNDVLKYEMRLKDIKAAIDKLPVYGKIKEVIC